MSSSPGMAVEMVHEAELWLPSETVYDDLVLAAEQEAVTCSPNSSPVSADYGGGGFASNPESPMTVSDEEDYMDGLTQRMTHSFLLDDDESSWKFAAACSARVRNTTGSPQSTLSSWSSSKKGSPDGASLVSSPPLSLREELQQQSKGDPWALLSEAAGQVIRLNDSGKDVEALSYVEQGKMSRPLPMPCNKAGTCYYSPSATIEQLRAAHFYRLKQLRHPKQSPLWVRHEEARGGGGGGHNEGRCGPLGLSLSAWPPLHQHQQPSPKPASGDVMRAVFLNSSSTRKDSVGTGVFIPRHAENIIDPAPRKKLACSTVLVPARVVQALNLNLEGLGAQRHFDGAHILGQGALVGRSMPHHKLNHPVAHPASVKAAGHELRLPREWTY